MKAGFKKQADAYRKLAIKRAKELGMPVPDVPPTANGRGPKVVNDAGPCFKAAIGFSGPVQ